MTCPDAVALLDRSTEATEVVENRSSIMSLRHFPRPIAVSTIGFVMLWPFAGFSQDSAPADKGSATEPAASSPTATMKLSYGVADILKLARAKVSAETIIAFIGNSGRIYNLSVNEILYLRTQGVGDRVLTAMLAQRKKLAESVAWPTPPSRASLEPKQSPPVLTAPAQSAAATTRPAPASVAPPPVYLLRNPPPVYSYYDYSPYYRSPASAFSLSFGFGSSYYRGGFGYSWGPYR